MADEELLTAGKIAKALGISAGKVSSYIKEKGLEPDKTKGSCKYYGPKTVANIKKNVK